ncbi:TetR/AcrR family transcriptional regulator [Paenibacillus popilliae]|uniref:TetR/AcrR family transcriptional regulator n=2 Tax=Paenibacillus popilliae TaxID=78057 RepID=A0ABY3AZ23_PAEPP|nr:TetR/AcrR family transcriptional regulator [Paenibacillus sp. SDF0028]
MILDAATKILVEKPTASLNDIADYAGVGIATLHRYFENREQLMLQLGLRAAKVVGETMDLINRTEWSNEAYIPALVEALIPLGDKIHFLTQDGSLNCNKEMVAAEEQILQRVRHTLGEMQQKGHLRQDMSPEWIANVLYSLLILAWQQVHLGNIAKNSAAKLVVDTLYNGVNA